MKPALRLIVCIAAFALSVSAQEPRTPTVAKPAKPRVVTAAQANGVYRSYDNEFRILALGKNKLKIQFDGIYHTLSKSVNTGYASGEASIEGDVAVFAPTDEPECRITIVFLQNNRLKVTQDGSDADCGFGHNVHATGTYRKVRWGRPKFDSPP